MPPLVQGIDVGDPVRPPAFRRFLQRGKCLQDGEGVDGILLQDSQRQAVGGFAIAAQHAVQRTLLQQARSLVHVCDPGDFDQGVGGGDALGDGRIKRVLSNHADVDCRCVNARLVHQIQRHKDKQGDKQNQEKCFVLERDGQIIPGKNEDVCHHDAYSCS